ncbi:MAG: M48 family metalloprotease [bacterium]|jgi:predicted Zn-dependent protease|nr:M48 family metalloprotease [candidate division KSB1 bacterium]MDH7561142.1 M48 family metalloprotease [bacterium]
MVALHRLVVNLLLMTAVLISIASCSSSVGTRHQVRLITVDQELELGRVCAKEVAQSYPPLADSEAEKYVAQLGQRIAAHSDWAGLNFAFRVIDSEEVYSFALPGGYAYLSRGMLELVDTACELAAVLAHEVAHVACRHGAEQVSARYGLALASESLFGANPALGRQVVAELFTPRGILLYGRAAEEEADGRALSYLEKAGYDPRGLLGVVERLRALEEQHPQALARWRVTHEPARQRLKWVKRGLRRVPATEALVEDEPGFRQIKSRLQQG